MKKLINEMKWFDKMDWGFFIGLSLMDLYMLAVLVFGIAGGAPVVACLIGVALVSLAVGMLVYASRYAISDNKRAAYWEERRGDLA